MTFIELLCFFLTGILTGLLSGLLGIGGGLIVVPALLFLFQHFTPQLAYPVHMAAGTSFAIMIITSISSTWHHQRYGGVIWPLYQKLLPAMVLGTLSGVVIANFLEGSIIKILFGFFLLFVAVRMSLLIQPKPTRTLPGRLGLSLFGYGVGLKSGMFGVGGGTLTVPFLTRCNVPMRQASGTSTICSFTIALVGTLGFIISGLRHPAQQAGFTGYIYWPAFFGVALGSLLSTPLGTYLAQVLPVNITKRIFAVLLLFVALRLIIY
ncbi:MAG: sulfite exporter TauE/SafE family protein [Legionellales bacterium]|nr:sulfite exporter TauE/SafE family protein [Legionellales bacterium]